MNKAFYDSVTEKLDGKQVERLCWGLICAYVATTAIVYFSNSKAKVSKGEATALLGKE